MKMNERRKTNQRQKSRIKKIQKMRKKLYNQKMYDEGEGSECP